MKRTIIASILVLFTNQITKAQSAHWKKLMEESKGFVTMYTITSLKTNIKAKSFYIRKIISEPLAQTSIHKNFNKLNKDIYKKVVNLLRESGIETNPNLNDTIVKSENELTYLKGDYRYTTYRYTTTPKDIYDSIVIDKSTRDSLNGFYKILSDKEEYDYCLGYFFKGDPYYHGLENVFEYYKNDKLVKRRFFSRTLYRFREYRYFKEFAIVEDYYPISKNKWKREIKTWPNEELLVEDTIVYKNEKPRIDGIQKLYQIDASSRLAKKIEGTGANSKTKYLDKVFYYSKGKIVKVKDYFQPISDYYEIIETVLNLENDSKPKLLIKKFDEFGNLVIKNFYVSLNKKNCSGRKLKHFDSERVGIPEKEQCFKMDGEQLEFVYLTNSDGSEGTLKSEIRIYFKKGEIDKYIRQSVNIKLWDSLTQKIYGDDLRVSENEIIDYRNKTINVKFYKNQNEKDLVLNVREVYEKCIDPMNYTPYCPDKSGKSEEDNKRKYVHVEYFGANGEKILDKKIRDSDKLNQFDLEEFLNKQTNKKRK